MSSSRTSVSRELGISVDVRTINIDGKPIIRHMSKVGMSSMATEHGSEVLKKGRNMLWLLDDDGGA